MAKKQEERIVEARVLCDYWDGTRTVRANEIVILDVDVLARYKAAGWVDDHPDAVAYVKRLKG